MGNMLFNIFIILWTFFCCFIGLPILFMRSPNAITSAAKWWISGILKGLKIFCGITYEVRGQENLSSSNRMILMSKHHSAFETFLLAYLVARPTYILKKELIFMPLVGLYLLFSKMITIDKASYALSFKNMVKKVRERINENRNVIIFPEGGRVDIDNSDSEYQRGVSILYTDPELQDVKFVPIALNCGVFWPRGLFNKKTSGTAIVKFLPPIKKSLSKKEFMETIQDVIDTESTKLIEEAYRKNNSFHDDIPQLKQ